MPVIPHMRIETRSHYASRVLDQVTVPDDAHVPREELEDLVACAHCRSAVSLPDAGQGACSSCGTPVSRTEGGWEMLPPREQWSSNEWAIWERLQANGAAGYEADPERNLGVGEREDCVAFSRFSRLEGNVLDVGCGPQAWPSYFAVRESGTRLLGVDPLVGAHEAAYTQFRALAEHLPFRDGTFDRVLYATTLDHFVDARAALLEAARVLAQNGRIMAWVGHKSDDAPAPETSPEWYTSLDLPEGAEDLFHVKRLTPDDTLALFAEAGLEVVESTSEQIDPYRSNHFFELVPAGA